VNCSARQEILDLIVFYAARGWDWLLPVQYLAAKALGDGPPWALRTRIGSGRPRREKKGMRGCR